MGVCSLCLHDFPLLGDDARACSRCLARKPGLSASEISALNTKPQCAACGVISSLLEDPLCRPCITYFKEQKALPFSFLSMKGVPQLFGPDPMDKISASGSLASAILSSASSHQRNASNVRFGIGPAKTTGSSSKPTSDFRNLSKANAVTKERKAKRIEMALKDNGIKISVQVWMSNGNDNDAKMKRAGQICVSVVKGPSQRLKEAIDELMSRAQKDFSTIHPDKPQLNRSNVTLLAHETVNKFTSLGHLLKLLTEGTVGELLDVFRSERLGSSIAINKREIEIRFHYCEPNTEDLDSEVVENALLSRTKRPRASSSTTTEHPEKRSARVLHANPIVLRSAFRVPTKKWSRMVDTISYVFTRYSAKLDGGVMNISQMGTTETIEIGSAWQIGKERQQKNEPYSETSFIGEGYSKHGIYARIGNKEFVLTQPFDSDLNEQDVYDILAAEYKVLAYCDYFKGEFDMLAKRCEIDTIPPFYFNFKDSILGRLQPSPSSGSHIIPHASFIATPLLPCGEVDGKVKKFTGNGEVGHAQDNMTKAIHAFVHFSLLYSHGHMIFCDLQGLHDIEQKMCLFDPQAHTNTSQCDRLAYWDHGLPQIEAFKRQHLEVCDDNWVCNKLRIKELIMVADSDGSEAHAVGPSSSPLTKGLEKRKRRTVSKRSLTYILDS